MASTKSFDTKVNEAIDAVKGRKLPGIANNLSLVGIAWGALAFGYGIFAGNAAWTWGALLVATFYAINISQGGAMYAVIMHGTFARWGRPLKRIGEAFAFFLPVAWVLLLIFLLGGMQVYEWHDSWFNGAPKSLTPHMQGAPNSKEFWLRGMGGVFFPARQLGGVGLLIFLDYLLIKNSLRPDLILAKARLGADAPAWWDRIIGGQTDAQAAADSAAYRNQILVPVIAASYAVIMSLLAFDLIMSLDVWWFSNMFGGWIFMSSILMALCGIAIVSTAGRDWLSLRDWATTTVTHDLGKLMLAGTMFWAYTFFAQLLPIYYTDVPEETNFLLVRMVLPQWQWLAKAVAIFCFVTPFTVLLSRGIKKMRWPFFAIAALILFGLFLERTLLVMPSAYLGDAFPLLDFAFVSFGVFAGVAGLFVQVVGRALAQLPAVPVADPLLEDHPWHVHVHAAGAHH